jgi:Tfp pilus assembly protein PilN
VVNLPNFSSRPYLNTRPVWILTTVALVVTLVLVVLNVRAYLASDHALAEHVALSERLAAEHQTLIEAIRADARALDQVPWRSLARRVENVNAIFAQHSFSWLALLDHVEAVLPYNVRLISIAPVLDGGRVKLTVKAVAQSREALLELLERLVADPHFVDPRPSREDWPEAAKTVGYLVNLQVDYLPEGEAP